MGIGSGSQAVWRDTIRACCPSYERIRRGAIINVTTSWAKTPPASSMPARQPRGRASHDQGHESRFGERPDPVNTVCIGMIRAAQLEERWKREEPGLTWEQYARDPRHRFHSDVLATRKKRQKLSYLWHPMPLPMLQALPSILTGFRSGFVSRQQLRTREVVDVKHEVVISPLSAAAGRAYGISQFRSAGGFP